MIRAFRLFSKKNHRISLHVSTTCNGFFAAKAQRREEDATPEKTVILRNLCALAPLRFTLSDSVVASAVQFVKYPAYPGTPTHTP